MEKTAIFQIENNNLSAWQQTILLALKTKVNIATTPMTSQTAI